MADPVNELYFNLNQLLNDVCKFLSNETNYQNLSQEARQYADELITRSKTQLQEIVKCRLNFTNDLSSNDESYVDMERKPELQENCDSNDENHINIYSSVDESAVIRTPSIVANPYAKFPARQLLQDAKSGPLLWKYRIIFNFEKTRKIFAGIHNDWLLIYNSEKDCKPMENLDLNHHEAQQTTTKLPFPQDFNVISMLPDKKTFYFVAVSYKDMLQWTTQINKSKENSNVVDRTKSEFRQSEIYDVVIKSCDNEEDDDVFYQDIVSPPPEEKVVKIPPKPPIRKGFKTNVPLPPIPPKPVQIPPKGSLRKKSVSSGSDSFSEDDEDAIYEAFVGKP